MVGFTASIFSVLLTPKGFNEYRLSILIVLYDSIESSLVAKK
jgi:hypothetical protein